MLFLRTLHNVGLHRVPTPLAVLLPCTALVLAAVVVQNHWRSYTRERACRGRLVTIVCAAEKYREARGVWVTGGREAVVSLVKAGCLPHLLTCPQGGSYSLTAGGGFLTVRCNEPNHGQTRRWITGTSSAYPH